MDTLLLDSSWDLKLDNKGNIAVANNGYAIAQDVASACRLFQGELWYDTTQGVPYFSQILGKNPPLGFLAAKFATAGETVPGVDTMAVNLNLVGAQRVLTGTLNITNTSGETTIISVNGGNLWYVTGTGNQDFGT